ncbi:hypothetical protein [Paenibacillus sp. B01]|uniref:hypothetical protein n=1 Tax=Paenibacillus sp. B01 TaxID=2660554 RepID=UPI00129B8B94|nr:hypothetical protein [Paenibacillus sp. B01]QGG54520.1 hypothetical protein GE073_02160 [Paenibacillus sp. B01]
MKSEKLTPYETAIARELHHHFGFSEEQGEELVIRYRTPIHRIGSYDPPYEHAEAIAKCVEKNISPARSAANIRKVSKQSKSDSGIDPLTKIEMAAALISH